MICSGNTPFCFITFINYSNKNLVCFINNTFINMYIFLKYIKITIVKQTHWWIIKTPKYNGVVI